MPHMKINIRKRIFPAYELPEGYTCIVIDCSELTERDRYHWKRIQHQRKNVKSHDKLILPEKGAAMFVKYHGEFIGCSCLKHISPDIIESQHAMVLPEHRRKGVFKALMGGMWRYCYFGGYTWVNLSPILQKPWWDSLGAEKNWAT